MNFHEESQPYGITNLISAKNHFVRSDFMPLDNLEMLRNAEISVCNAEELTDLRNVRISREKSFGERTSDYIGQVRNPYLFRVGNTVVKVEFSDGKAFADLLTDVILAG